MDAFLKKSKQYAITSITTGSLSFLCSSAIVCILLRSHAGLSKTYHRLLLGMCIGDMISSLAYMMSTAAMPLDVDYYVWNARGNVASCDAQGFLSMFGIIVTSGYNCSLCLFYLAVINFKKKNKYITKRLEPWMHAIPIIAALTLAIAGLVSKVYNAGLANCFVTTHDPPHCSGVDEGVIPDGFEIPCGRGTRNHDVFYIILLVKNLGILPGVILGSMTMMFMEVWKTENKLGKYGKNSLRFRNEESNLGQGQSEENNRSRNRQRSSISKRLVNSISRSLSGAFRRNAVGGLISSNTHKNTRKVLNRALSYAMAYLATYLFPIIVMIDTLANKGKPFQFNIPLTLSFVFHPLQGLFNFMVFMYPRIVTAKGKRTLDGEERSWYGAFVHALVSRGEKKGRTRSSSGRGSQGKGSGSQGKGAKRGFPLRSRNTNASGLSNADIDPHSIQTPNQEKKKYEKQRSCGEGEEKCEIEGNICYSLPTRMTTIAKNAETCTTEESLSNDKPKKVGDAHCVSTSLTDGEVQHLTKDDGDSSASAPGSLQLPVGLDTQDKSSNGTSEITTQDCPKERAGNASVGDKENERAIDHLQAGEEGAADITTSVYAHDGQEANENDSHVSTSPL